MQNSAAKMPAVEKNNNSTVTPQGSSSSKSQQVDYERSSSQGSDHSSLSSRESDEQNAIRLSSADYDHIRNTTLMFFLDRLFLASKEGKEARTLHDLSCLFGTKDFTKEMRQIVGASRNGLKKFLQAYPSLFTIESDKVYLTQLEQEASQSARDYNKEAVEYFRQKLLQFGASLVPIKNLFGYRSQASQEVRHVSGKNAKEFRQFLSQNEDVFELLNEDHVILKSALAELDARGESAKYASLQPMSLGSQLSQSDDNQVIDPYLNKQFAHIVESCLRVTLQAEGHNLDDPHESAAKIAIEVLHDKILKECNNQLFLKMVKTTDDFRVFLRTHPKIFKRTRCDQEQREYVGLLTDQERREFETQTYPSQQQVLTRQHSTLKQDIAQMSQPSDKQQSPSSPNSAQSPSNLDAKSDTKQAGLESTVDQATESSRSNDSHQSTGNYSHATVKREDQDELRVRDQPKSGLSPPSTNGSVLRATAPPFVPSSTGRQQLRATQSHLASTPTCTLGQVEGGGAVTVFPPSPPQVANPLQRSKSNLNSSSPVIDPRQSLRSYLIKANANNSSGGVYSPSKQSNGALYQAPGGNKVLVRQTSALNNDDMRARTVDIVREASNIITRIMTTTDAVAFDCKGYNLDFNGQITLIQFAFLPGSTKSTSIVSQHDLIRSASVDQQAVAGESAENHETRLCSKRKPEVCIFDLITNPELAYCLKPLLESEQIVKIVHDVRSKSCALHGQFGIMLNRVFDTQVANLVIQQQETGKPAYKSRYISMSKLCEVYGDEDLIKYRNLIKSKTRHSAIGQSTSGGKIKDVNYWRQRPLTEAMVYESTMDVYCLVGGVYQKLKSQIQVEYMPLFDQLNLEGVLARIKPDEIRSVKKERKIDLEVIDLKRKLYAETTCSIVLSNREVRLLRHIDLTEEVRNKIQQCKKVAKKLERLDMKAAQNAQLSMGSIQEPNSDTDIKSLENNNQSGSATNNSESSSQSSTVADDNNTTEALAETCMTNLMDSSMFDELKVKMIESSTLLESLEDDDDDINVDVSQSIHESCRCSCHHRSPNSSGEFNSADKHLSPSLKSSTSEKDDASIESRSVDMAVQCDLLN